MKKKIYNPAVHARKLLAWYDAECDCAKAEGRVPDPPPWTTSLIELLVSQAERLIKTNKELRRTIRRQNAMLRAAKLM